ncbi:MAG: polyphosphate kinase 2 family protein [Bacteroidetes bacterium]|nr:polyphosphate kinase 2 family protein [Bacteroidota bacterium]
MNIKDFIVKDGAKSKFKLSRIKTDDTNSFKSKDDSLIRLEKNIEKLSNLQDKLYAQGKHGIVLIFQAMDTAGKDGAIKHVMSGLNPQGTSVYSFKQPSVEDLKHDYLWRANKHLPERGQIGIFNRSYYEELLVVRVHDLLKTQNIPEELITDHIWKDRYQQINNYEQYLAENGFLTIKLFLHISKEEQKERLLSRIDDKSKNWKFSEADLKERGYWQQYQDCYEELLQNTSTERNPWFIIPSDKKWFARLLISEIIVQHLEDLNLAYPNLDPKQEVALEECKKQLLNE